MILKRLKDNFVLVSRQSESSNSSELLIVITQQIKITEWFVHSYRAFYLRWPNTVLARAFADAN